MELHFSEKIKNICPQLCVGALEAEVKNSAFNDKLWKEITTEENSLMAEFTPESLKQRSGISATRKVYRALGKDPSRYRPSNEALVRRLLQGKHLYQISTLVDINNLASIKWAYSIGGFDKKKIEGTELTLDVGNKNDLYEGIGRGLLNIEFLPVYRDAKGGIGTPTSDNERTKISLETSQLLFLINGYDGDEKATLDCGKYLQDLLKKYCFSNGGSLFLFKP